MSLAGKSVVLIGGGSGIGLAVGRRATAAGARLILGGRNAGRLAAAAAQLGGEVQTFTVDTQDGESLRAFFDQVGALDHLFVSAADYVVVPITDHDISAAESPFKSKFWGQYRAIQAALAGLARDGSITLMSGAASVRPVRGGAAYAACNAAIEALGKALAGDLAPIRVNTVAPGTIDGHLWQQRSAALRDAAFESFGAQSLVGRPGLEDEIAQAVIYLMTNRFTTGTTLYPDGGYSLR